MFLRRRRPIEEPATEPSNMTPMIDVVFQLLIFFMLTMHFKEVEGKLLSQLPKSHGPRTSDVPPPPLQELRIFVCAGGGLDEHRTNKGRHVQADKPAETCAVAVEGHMIGEVRRTETQPSAASSNKGIYRAAAARLKELHDRMAGAKFMIVLDADSEVPYEHVIGLVNACKEVKVEDIEFVANPRHDRYYGSYEKGQFQRLRK
jgi:biopolymer transport protein ExbD